MWWRLPVVFLLMPGVVVRYSASYYTRHMYHKQSTTSSDEISDSSQDAAISPRTDFHPMAYKSNQFKDSDRNSSSREQPQTQNNSGGSDKEDILNYKNIIKKYDTEKYLQAQTSMKNPKPLNSTQLLLVEKSQKPESKPINLYKVQVPQFYASGGQNPKPLNSTQLLLVEKSQKPESKPINLYKVQVPQFYASVGQSNSEDLLTKIILNGGNNQGVPLRNALLTKFISYNVTELQDDGRDKSFLLQKTDNSSAKISYLDQNKKYTNYSENHSSSLDTVLNPIKYTQNVPVVLPSESYPENTQQKNIFEGDHESKVNGSRSAPMTSSDQNIFSINLFPVSENMDPITDNKASVGNLNIQEMGNSQEESFNFPTDFFRQSSVSQDKNTLVKDNSLLYNESPNEFVGGQYIKQKANNLDKSDFETTHSDFVGGQFIEHQGKGSGTLDHNKMDFERKESADFVGGQFIKQDTKEDAEILSALSLNNELNTKDFVGGQFVDGAITSNSFETPKYNENHTRTFKFVGGQFIPEKTDTERIESTIHTTEMPKYDIQSHTTKSNEGMTHSVTVIPKVNNGDTVNNHNNTMNDTVAKSNDSSTNVNEKPTTVPTEKGNIIYKAYDGDTEVVISVSNSPDDQIEIEEANSKLESQDYINHKKGPKTNLKHNDDYEYYLESDDVLGNAKGNNRESILAKNPGSEHYVTELTETNVTKPFIMEKDATPVDSNIVPTYLQINDMNSLHVTSATDKNDYPDIVDKVTDSVELYAGFPIQTDMNDKNSPSKTPKVNLFFGTKCPKTSSLDVNTKSNGDLAQLCLPLTNETYISILDLLSGPLYLDKNGKKIAVRLREDQKKNSSVNSKQSNFFVDLKHTPEPINIVKSMELSKEDEISLETKHEKRHITEELLTNATRSNTDLEMDPLYPTPTWSKQFLNNLSGSTLQTEVRPGINTGVPVSYPDDNSRRADENNDEYSYSKLIPTTNENHIFNLLTNETKEIEREPSNELTGVHSHRLTRMIDDGSRSEGDKCGCSSNQILKSSNPLPNYKEFVNKRFDILKNIVHTVNDWASK